MENNSIKEQAQRIWGQACRLVQEKIDEEAAAKKKWEDAAIDTANLLKEIFECAGQPVTTSVNYDKRRIFIEAGDDNLDIELSDNFDGVELRAPAPNAPWELKYEFINSLAKKLADGEHVFSYW